MLYRLRVTRLLLRRINLNTTRQLSEDIPADNKEAVEHADTTINCEDTNTGEETLNKLGQRKLGV